MHETKHLLLDGSRGIYIPKAFVENHDLSLWDFPECLDRAEVERILSDPYNEAYWDTWDDVIRNVVFHSDGTKGFMKGTWHLEQDDDLFIVHQSYYEASEGDSDDLP